MSSKLGFEAPTRRWKIGIVTYNIVILPRGLITKPAHLHMVEYERAQNNCAIPPAQLKDLRTHAIIATSRSAVMLQDTAENIPLILAEHPQYPKLDPRRLIRE